MYEDSTGRESPRQSVDDSEYTEFGQRFQNYTNNNNVHRRKASFESEGRDYGAEKHCNEEENQHILDFPWKTWSLQRIDEDAQPTVHRRKSSQAYIDEVASHHRNIDLARHSSSRRSKRHRERFKSDTTSSPESPIFSEAEEVLSPHEQVQFLLGGRAQDEGCEDGEHFRNNNTHFPRLFTEMEELHTGDDGEPFWKETARWIKFEESVEAGGDRWSKPHVSSLSLHSLFELRSCIINGIIQLDMDACGLEQVADIILDAMIAQEHLPHDDKVRERVRALILSVHEHQNERKATGLNPIKSVTGMMSRRESSAGFGGMLSISNFRRKSTFTSIGSNDPSLESDRKAKIPYFMKKIPIGAEACNVMVGEIDFLERPVASFLRLQDSVQLEGMTEVPVPTRFLFVLLGPFGNRKRYHEIGRSVGTLMADEVFHDVAYKATTRNDLLAGIDEFLSHVTVLPPTGWDSNIRIEPPQDLPNNQMSRLQTKGNDSLMGSDAKLESALGLGPELQRTGRLFGGLINDIKRKAPFYVSDFRDALSLQCVASFIFLYFAVLTPIVTFGGLLGDATHNSISAMESIFGGAMAGIAFHLFSGQPLTIIGSTGPILVFEKILFEICHSTGIDYLSIRWWVGTWTGLFCIILVATDASSLVQYITRFTEESFSALISLIFIYQAFKKLNHISDELHVWHGWNPDLVTHYECTCVAKNISSLNITEDLNYKEISWKSQEVALKSHHENHTGTLYRTGDDSYVCSYDGYNYNVSDINNVSWASLNTTECLTEYCGELEGSSCAYTPDAMLMSVMLFFGTFAISWFLKSLKMSRFFPTKVRSVISDFAVTIAISLMVLFDIAMNFDTPKLHVPGTFRPTRGDRDWIIPPLGKNEWWTIPASIVPALVCTILIFMDQQITAVIVNRKENKLKKGCGYHLDLLVVSIMMIICSVLGLPWFVAATVLSITHVNSLKMESESAAPGETPKFLGVREQRVTGIMIFLLIGLSVFMTPVLAFIPMPVLYGVFLYMGVSSLKGVQFIDRCQLFFMPPKHQPDYIYLRHVPLPKVYLFTFFQAAGLGLLWMIKSLPHASIIFPMMVAALVLVRKAFDYCMFTQEDLYWLDDIMPELTKRKKEEEKKKATSGGDSDNVSVEDGKVLKMPAVRFDYKRGGSSDIKLSDSMAQTSIWKTTIKKDDRCAVDLKERESADTRKERMRDENIVELETTPLLECVTESPPRSPLNVQKLDNVTQTPPRSPRNVRKFENVTRSPPRSPRSVRKLSSVAEAKV